MKKPKLVICDIDSTLVVKHESLTPSAKTVIDTLRKEGVYFGIASGRPLYQIRNSMQSWGYDDFDIIIGLNGSALWDSLNQQEYNYFIMKKEWIKETIDLMKPFKTNPSIYRGEKQLFYKEDELMEMYARKTGLKVEKAKNIEDFYSEDTAKIMFRVEEEDMADIEQYLADHPSENFTGFKTQPTLIEFCDKRINKGYALEKFCAMHQIDLADVIAFGDTTNDNEMLIKAGTGVCMKNGSEDTKAIADIITEKECDDDGWADFMNHHIMNQLI